MSCNYVVSVLQDNYGRWFVEAALEGRKRAPVRCLTEREARAFALDLEQAFEARRPQRLAA